MSDKGPTDLAGMGMVLLRLLRWLIWPRHEREPADDLPRRGRRRPPPRRRPHQPGVYRIEVDGEAGRFHGDGTPFSFWSSSRVILILAFLLWWVQPAGPMIAGYVGGRRSGSPMKAVLAALLPVAAIYLANASYAANVAARQIDFVASLPTLVTDGLSSILPFLAPYKEFLISYMAGFVAALTTTFGMGTNGYLMVIIFAYIGGLIAEQTRRELASRSGRGSSFGVNLVQPLVGARPYVDEEEEAYEEDEELHPHRRPVRSRARRHPVVVGLEPRRRRDRGVHFESFHKVSALAEDEFGRRTARRRHRHEDDEEDEEDDEGEEVVVRRTHRVSHEGTEDEPERRRRPHHRERDDEEVPEEHAPRPVRTRSQAEERAIQRFVERALRNYDHSRL